MNKKRHLGCQAGGFLAGGATGTAVHYLVFALLFTLRGAHPVAATTAGAVAGGVTVYFFNYYITFNSSKPHTESLARFIPMAGAGLIINGAVFAAAMALSNWPVILCQAAATSCQAGAGFAASRMWVY